MDDILGELGMTQSFGGNDLNMLSNTMTQNAEFSQFDPMMSTNKSFKIAESSDSNQNYFNKLIAEEQTQESKSKIQDKKEAHSKLALLTQEVDQLYQETQNKDDKQTITQKFEENNNLNKYVELKRKANTSGELQTTKKIINKKIEDSNSNQKQKDILEFKAKIKETRDRILNNIEEQQEKLNNNFNNYKRNLIEYSSNIESILLYETEYCYDKHEKTRFIENKVDYLFKEIFEVLSQINK